MSYTDYLISIRQLSIINEYDYENNIKKPSFTGNFYFKGLISNFYNKSYTCKQSHKILRYIQWLIINVKKKNPETKEKIYFCLNVSIYSRTCIFHIYTSSLIITSILMLTNVRFTSCWLHVRQHFILPHNPSYLYGANRMHRMSKVNSSVGRELYV